MGSLFLSRGRTHLNVTRAANHVRTLALTLVVGSYVQLGEKPKENHLNARYPQEDTQKEERVGVEGRTCPEAFRSPKALLEQGGQAREKGQGEHRRRKTPEEIELMKKCGGSLKENLQ